MEADGHLISAEWSKYTPKWPSYARSHKLVEHTITWPLSEWLALVSLIFNICSATKTATYRYQMAIESFKKNAARRQHFES